MKNTLQTECWIYNSVSKDSHVHQKSKALNEVQLCTGCAEKHHLSNGNCVAIAPPKST